MSHNITTIKINKVKSGLYTAVIGGVSLKIQKYDSAFFGTGSLWEVEGEGRIGQYFRGVEYRTLKEVKNAIAEVEAFGIVEDDYSGAWRLNK